MIKENIHNLLKEIPSNVKLIAVSKTKSVENIMEAYETGLRDFGENNILELVDKYNKLPKDIRWHMIGHIQTNKLKKIIGLTYLIHSVDSIKLAELINKYSKDKNIVTNILLEVNIANEETKYGFKDDIYNAYNNLKNLNNIKINGLMCVLPNINDEKLLKKYILKLHEIGNQLNLNTYSCGMSNDYKIAIEIGTTYVRIGSKIFGERDYRKKL